jgi:hypothetical protein
MEPAGLLIRFTRMTADAYEEGYRAGWEGVAGAAPLPADPAQPPEGTARDYQHGFEYGRADALERFQPAQTPEPRKPARASSRPELKLVPKQLDPTDPAGKLGDMGKGSREQSHGGR